MRPTDSGDTPKDGRVSSTCCVNNACSRLLLYFDCIRLYPLCLGVEGRILDIRDQKKKKGQDREEKVIKRVEKKECKTGTEKGTRLGAWKRIMISMVIDRYHQPSFGICEETKRMMQNQPTWQ